MGRFLGRLGLLLALAGVTGVALVRLEGPGGPAGGTRTLRYQFVDDAGRVQIVDSLEAVPPGKREGVGRIEIEAPAAAESDASGSRLPFLAWLRDLSGSGGRSRKSDAKLILYTTQRCGFSKRLRAELDERGVAYENRDIDLDRQAQAELVELTGREGVPVSVYGEQVWQGYNPQRAREIESAVEGGWFF